jgi:hypothetical protein
MNSANRAMAAAEHSVAGTVERADSTLEAARALPAQGPSAAAAGLSSATGITRDSTVTEAAQQLAAQLRGIDGIERYRTTKLGDLSRTGPRPLRALWGVASEQLGRRYGSLTVGELMDRYRQRGGPGASAGA